MHLWPPPPPPPTTALSTSIIHLFGILQTLNDSKPRYVSMDWTAAITDENQLKNQSSAVLAGK